MKAFSGLRRLTTIELGYIPEAAFYLLISRIEISFFSSKIYLQKNFGKLTILISQKKDNTVNSIAKVINGVALRVPWSATCLVKVLAAHKMLLKRGISHSIHFGIKRISPQRMEAHAWLSVNNEIVIGGGNLQDFKEINVIDV